MSYWFQISELLLTSPDWWLFLLVRETANQANQGFVGGVNDDSVIYLRMDVIDTAMQVVVSQLAEIQLLIRFFFLIDITNIKLTFPRTAQAASVSNKNDVTGTDIHSPWMVFVTVQYLGTAILTWLLLYACWHAHNGIANIMIFSLDIMFNIFI